jgi:hypothetical protein
MAKVGALFFICLLLVFAIGCSSNPEPQKASAPTETKKKEPYLYTGKACLSQMVNQVQRWSLDATPIHLESKLNSESNGQGGKSTIWEATMVSPAKGKAKIFTCSGSVLPESPAQGVTAGPEMAASAAAPMFVPSLLSFDSDAAYTLAQEKGGAKLLEKDPKQPVVYMLDWDPKKRELLWGVIYGTDLKDSKGVGVIDASTGKFLRAGK